MSIGASYDQAIESLQQDYRKVASEVDGGSVDDGREQ